MIGFEIFECGIFLGGGISGRIFLGVISFNAIWKAFVKGVGVKCRPIFLGGGWLF